MRNHSTLLHLRKLRPISLHMYFARVATNAHGHRYLKELKKNYLVEVHVGQRS